MKLYLLPISEVSLIPYDYCMAHFPTRFERSKRFRREEDQLRCIGAGALISSVLRENEKNIVTGAHGKPYLRNRGTFFNISHSGNYIIMAVDSEETGTDIEIIKEPPESVERRVFTAEERSWMNGDSERFFILWTLKESVLKALGMGLTLDPSMFSVMNAINGCSIKTEGKTIFCSYTIYDGHVISTSSFSPINEIELNIISINDIIE